MSGRIKFQGKEESCIAEFTNLSIYQWQTSRPVRSCYLLVDGKKVALISDGTGDGDFDSIQLAVAKEDDKVTFYMRLGGASINHEVRFRVRSWNYITARQVRLEEQTRLLQLEGLGSDSELPKKLEIIAE
jgi:hypothetical protein